MRPPFRWPWSIAVVWLTLPVVGALVAATLEPIPPHDYWWHLAMGRLIDVSGELPAANLFLYTMPADAPFVDQPWLGQLLMWWAYDAAGHTGTVLLRNLFLGGAIALVIATALRRCGDPRAAGALGLLAAALAYPVMTVRTRMFAFLPFAAVLWATFGVADGRLSRRWLALPAVATAFWVNTHGSFVLGPLIVCGVGAGVVLEAFLKRRTLPVDHLKTWGIAGGATILAGAAGPHGFGSYAYVFQLAIESSVATSVSEWLPPDISRGIGVLFLAAVTGAVGLLAVRRRQVHLAEVFIFAGTLYLSAGAVRSIFWWAAVLPVVAAPHLAALLPESDEEEPGQGAAVAHALAVGVLVLLTVFVQPGVGRAAVGQWMGGGIARQSGEGAWLLNHENAERAVRQIRADDRKRVFHAQSLGGMLEFWLTDGQPDQVAFVDQRMEFVPQDVWDQYFVVSDGLRWREAVDAYGIDTMLLSNDSQWPLMQEVAADPEWELRLVDDSHVLFYRVTR